MNPHHLPFLLRVAEPPPAGKPTSRNLDQATADELLELSLDRTCVAIIHNKDTRLTRVNNETTDDQ